MTDAAAELGVALAQLALDRAGGELVGEREDLREHQAQLARCVLQAHRLALLGIRQALAAPTTQLLVIDVAVLKALSVDALDAPTGRMSHSSAVLHALDHAADALSEAATHLTLAILAAGHTPLGHDAYVLAVAGDAELAAVGATRLRHTPS